MGIASYNIFVGVYVATIFGSAFFFDLFWPERQESSAVKLVWRICSVLACLFTLSCALAYTDIVAKGSAYVSGVNAAETQKLLAMYGGSPMRYRDNGRAIASVVFLWPGMVFTFVRYAFYFLPFTLLAFLRVLKKLTVETALTSSGILWLTSTPTVPSRHTHAPVPTSRSRWMRNLRVWLSRRPMGLRSRSLGRHTQGLMVSMTAMRRRISITLRCSTDLRR